MPDQLAAPSGTVHWIGTGLSTGAGLRLLTESAERVVLWARTAERAQQCLDRLGIPATTAVRAYDPAALASELAAGDVVVSMLPATEHAALARLCTEHGAHFACSSYTSEELAEAAVKAGQAGLAVLTEAGLDPGIDHLFAEVLMGAAQSVVDPGAAASADFISYCGGLPAEPNEFRYRFSWAPRGVLNALRAPAHYIADGALTVAELPWEVTRPYRLGDETFEVYPNRDSLPYIQRYGVPDSWRLNTFVRGTLRLDGWSHAWRDVFAEVRTGNQDRITALAGELAARYPTTDADRDRVVLVVGLTVTPGDGVAWSGECRLDLTGSAAESAMARCVSVPLAFGVQEILAGRFPAGLVQAAPDGASARRWLEFLRANGIPITFGKDVLE